MLGFILFVTMAMLIAWLLYITLEQQEGTRKRAAKRITKPRSIEQDLQISVSVETTEPELSPETIKAREEYEANIVRPPKEWKLERNSDGSLIVDADWQFVLQAKSEEEWQLYVYSIKEYPELLKIGIAKDAVKRKEKYYKRKLHLLKLPKREAILVEHLFKHATYHLANKNPPKWNVGNIDEDNLIDEIQEFAVDNYEGSGLSEVRKMTVQQAKNTLREIWQLVHWQFVDEAIAEFGIKTFDLNQSAYGRETIEIPHLRWQTKPYPYQIPKKPSREDYSGEHWQHLDQESIDSLIEFNKERYQEDLKEFEKLKSEFWSYD